MTQPVVGIITRTKDRPLLLRRAIASIQAQTFENWVHVIVNDGGDPATVAAVIAERASAYRDRLIHIDHSRSQGMEAASNTAIRACSSQFIVIHDDDDSWKPDFLARMVPALEKLDERFGGIICHSILVQEEIQDNRIETLHSWSFNSHLEAIGIALLARRNLFPPISFLFRRSAYETVGPYRETLHVQGDWEFNLRMARRFEIAVLPEELALYHQRPKIDAGTYANTVIGSVDRHHRQETILRNELIRHDLDDGQIGIGTLAMLASLIEGQVVCVPHDIAGDYGLPGSARQAIALARQQAITAQESLAASLDVNRHLHEEQRKLIERLYDQQLEKEAERVRHLEHMLQALQNSTSWRLTAPLRSVVELLRALRARL